MGRDASVLGTYILPGPAVDPVPGLDQIRAAERIGLGSVWISELQGPNKDAGAICGYMGALTSRITLGTSITHFGTRHPMVMASWGATMQSLTGGRFVLGFGRSVAYRWVAYGIPVPNIPAMADHVDILRRLWRGETVSYDGPAGRYPSLNLGESIPGGGFPEIAPPPLMLAAVGPKTLELAGRSFDGVFLHGFLTTEATERSRAIVRDAAERAGRDPDSVAVYSELVCTPDFTDEEVELVVGARLTHYASTPNYGEMLCTANGWDPAPLDALRAAVATAIADNDAAGRPLSNRELYMVPSRQLPEHWKVDGAAMGTARDVANRLHDYLDRGADRVRVHGVTPDRLEPTVKAFESAKR
jgi:5,10-methylenetetrahydromethanopterin reductase